MLRFRAQVGQVLVQRLVVLEELVAEGPVANDQRGPCGLVVARSLAPAPGVDARERADAGGGQQAEGADR